MYRALLCLALSSVAAVATLHAQKPLSTDIWVGDLTHRGESWRLTNVRNLTDRDGYDNQPAFFPDGTSLMYTSQRAGQTDIYEVDLASRATRPLTRTPESEYSPQFLPDGSGFSVVRVESDGTQRLWSFPFDGAAPSRIAPRAKGIGYYAWLDASTLAAFVLGEPPTLRLLKLSSGDDRAVASGIGRCLHEVPGTHEISFTAADGDGVAIYAYDPATGKTRRLAPASPSEEHDDAWTPDGTLVAGVGSVLFRLKPGRDVSWIRFADLSRAGVLGITRLAVGPAGRTLAFVAER